MASEDQDGTQTGSEAMADKGARKLRLAKLWPLGLVILGIVAFFALGLDQYLSFEALREHRQALLQWTAANKILAAAGFIFGYFVMVALSLPGAVWGTLAGGFLFGTGVAAFYVVSGATLGAAAIFLIARYALADFFRAKAGGAIARMEAGFNANALSYMLVLRLVPLFPFWLVNLVPAFLGVPLRTFVIGTFFGIMPGSIVYCSVGSGLGAIFEADGTPDLHIFSKPEIIGPIIGLALLSLIPVFYKRFRAKPGAAAGNEGGN